MVFNERQQEEYTELLRKLNADNRAYFPEQYQEVGSTVYDIEDFGEFRPILLAAAKRYGYDSLHEALTVKFKILAMEYKYLLKEQSEGQNINQDRIKQIKLELDRISSNIKWLRDIQQKDRDIKLSLEIKAGLQQKYKDRIQQYEADIKQLYEDRENEREKLAKKIKVIERRVIDLRGLVEPLKQLHQQCEEERERLVGEAKLYNDLLVEKRGLEVQLEALKSSGYERESEELQSLRRELTKTKTESQEVLENLKRDYEELLESARETNRLQEETDMQKEQLENRLNGLKRQFKEFQTRTDEAAIKRINKHAEALRQLQKTKDICEKKNKELVNERDSQTALLEQVRLQLEEKEVELAEKIEKIKTNIRKNEGHERLILEARKELTKVNGELIECKRQLDSVKRDKTTNLNEFEEKLSEIQNTYENKLKECEQKLEKSVEYYKDQLASISTPKYLGSPNNCNKSGWVVNPETGRCWIDKNPGYIRRPRWTPDKNSPKFKSKRSKSKKWELNPKTGRYRLKEKKGHLRDPATGKWYKV